jgi:thiol:disulfide interchange protein DsbC
MMMLPPRLWIAASTCLLLAYAPSVQAFQKDATPRKECGECHALTVGEAQKIFGETVDNVVAVLPGPFQGIWEIDVEKAGKTYPVYLDYSGSYIFNGQIIRVRDRQNLTSRRYADLNRIDVSTIPLADAIVLGNPGAKYKVIVFDDPDCPWCRKLHGEIKQIVARDPDVAFFIRVYSRNNNPATVKKALSIVCGKKDAAKLLDDAFAGKKLPAPGCKTKTVEETTAIARRLGIQGTPAIVLPDGRLISGYMPADKLLGLIRSGK